MYDTTIYYEGKAAYREGWEREENPYEYASDEAETWLAGWDDASDEDYD